ncbi:MAG: hypothetical protein KatS3mg076_1007 [Candidatus Binatia bacterium]|nr:MAG: hypothetical protein KatS3mg076_1007 [Candidatus Binatia bacterium]
MKRVRRSSFPVRGAALLVGLLVLPGCTEVARKRTPDRTGVAESRAEVSRVRTETHARTRAATSRVPLEVREIRVVEDNGQEGVFVKLNRPVGEVSHFSLPNSPRIVVELEDGPPGPSSVERFEVGNPKVREIALGTGGGKLRLGLELAGDRVPEYTVDTLGDTLVAFVGEPSGKTGEVREKVVWPAEAAAAGGSTAERSDATEREGGNPARKLYTGRRISLDFKDADVHNVLRLLAEVSGLNIVATDDVQGKVTLKLHDVPWDQALDILLQAMGLESVQEGNVLRISTVRRLKEEREELARAQEAAKAVEPLRVAYIRLNYAKAKKLAELIRGEEMLRLRGFGGARTSEEEVGILSQRGSVMVDEFTNTLIVRDIQRGIDNVREMVRQLDVQTPQVLIESVIVEATTDFARSLGVQWGYRGNFGPQTGTPTGLNFPGSIEFGGAGLGTGSGNVPFLVDFPAGGNFGPGAGSAFDLLLGSVDGTQALNARLSALEEQGKGKVISRPRVVTLNNVPATIKSLTILRVKLPSTGTVINTGAGGAAGAQTVATEKIETGIILTVTPLVSSDGFVLLDLSAKSSQADFSRTVDSIPTEISREANSHILVKDGQTVVLGGIYRDTTNTQKSGVPFFSDIPVLGSVFRSLLRSDRREDLLVFLTPRVLGGPVQGLPTAQDLWLNRDRG